jgi:hypothetical protein
MPAAKVSTLSDSYAKASESLVGLTANVDAGRSAGEGLSKMSTNLTASTRCTNATAHQPREARGRQPDVRRHGRDAHQPANSVDDTKRYKENIAELSDNLAKLNTVYGNMLNAMTVR